MNHPDENALVEFVHGLLAPEARALVDSHLVSCAACRQLVAAVASDDASGARPLSVAPVVGKMLLAPAALEPGQHIARYVVLNRIGEGGMGVVYSAHDPNLNRRVAIKMLRSEDDFGSQRARMFREAQAMARLSHPNVVGVYDVGEHEGHVYLAMEYVEGVTLSEWLATPRTTREVLDVFVQAGKGLAAAHAAGLVHRDFKPSNVLVEADGRARVTDFGLARTASSSDAARVKQDVALRSMEATELTRTGMVMGTPAYMSWEQLSGEQTDLRTDQFSFCVALYEALFGVRPFKGSDLATLLIEITAGHVQPPQGDRRVASTVRKAVLRGLAAEPGARFHSMDALCAELVGTRSRAWVPIAGGVSLALLAGAVAWRVMSAQPLPPKVIVAKPALAPVPTPTPAATPPAVQPPEPKPVVVAPPRPHAPKPAPRSGTGFLAVHVAPWGDMFVDDRKLDSANMMDSVAELSAGTHRLRVSNPKLGERSEQIVIEPAKTLDKKIDLARGR